MITICVALEAELPESPGGEFQVLYTGVGKVQAATTLCKHLCHINKPTEIWNYGTAGGLNPMVTGLNEVSAFVQRDMMAEPQAPRGSIPFTEPLLGDIKTQNKNAGVRCGTGDSFVMGSDPWFTDADIDCVDMEGWALAYVCQQYKIPFKSWKYISDMADENAMKDWSANVANGAEIFKEKVRNGI